MATAAAFWHGEVEADPPLAPGRIVKASLDGADLINGQFANVVELILDGADTLLGEKGAARLRLGLARALSCFPLAGARLMAPQVSDERTWKLEAGPGSECAAELRIFAPEQTFENPRLPVSVRLDSSVFGSRVLSAAVQVQTISSDDGKHKSARARFVIAACHYLFDAMSMSHFLNLWSDCTQAKTLKEVQAAAQRWPLHKSESVHEVEPIDEAEERRLIKLLQLQIHPCDANSIAQYDLEIAEAMSLAAQELTLSHQVMDISPAELRALKEFVHRHCLESNEWATTHEILTAIVLRGQADAKSPSPHHDSQVSFVQVVNIRGRSPWFPDRFAAGNPLVREKIHVRLRSREGRTPSDWIGEAVRHVHRELRQILNEPGRIEAEYRLDAILRARGEAHRANMSRAFADIFNDDGYLVNSWVAGSWFSATFGAERVASIQEPAGLGHLTVPRTMLVLPTDAGQGRRLHLNFVRRSIHDAVALVFELVREAIASAS
ncbi:Hypothetical Protein FCC1311_015502 [Hondaea fermentalgiana]|uniref:Uncharacterized protein n=1 Tax=Hondaea fermentalgiana TaxID=2315210 RepID=A0A2R5G2V1_9STRA|nr:Hypothetical Protein FCC1311_015502 [Hondaea fermentalgiana]|eukprot:GBG25332.1 Hypothetical Protein FCC1311_015502 [Hondaea fermentalgiana]